MNKLIFILLLFNPLSISGDYPLKDGKPTDILLKFKIKKSEDEFGPDEVYVIYDVVSKRFGYPIHNIKEITLARGYDPLGIEADMNSPM